MEAIVFIIVQIFFATRAVLKIDASRPIVIITSDIPQYWPSVTRLDQSRASENI